MVVGRRRADEFSMNSADCAQRDRHA